MADYSPISSETGPVTLTAGGVITGGLLVKLSADDTVIHTTSSTTERAIGVTAHDAPSGGRVTVWPLSGMIHEVAVESGVTLAAGNTVVSSTTSGRITGYAYATSATGTLGLCVRGTTGTAAGAKARFIGF